MNLCFAGLSPAISGVFREHSSEPRAPIKIPHQTWWWRPAACRTERSTRDLASLRQRALPLWAPQKPSINAAAYGQVGSRRMPSKIFGHFSTGAAGISRRWHDQFARYEKRPRVRAPI